MMVDAGLQLVVAEQVADRLEEAHQWAFLKVFLGGCVRTMKRLRAWRRTISGMFLSPTQILRSRVPSRPRNCTDGPPGVLGLRTSASATAYVFVHSRFEAMDLKMSSW